jgi:hypothetical protein
MPAQGLGRRFALGASLMERLYLQDALPREKIQFIVDWNQRIAIEAPRDTLWVIADGAILDTQGFEDLRTAYGDPIRAFDNTALADYEELGLLLWPLSRAIEKDSAETLRAVLSGRPGLSFVRTNNSLALLTHTLTWLSGVVAEDGLPLYLRIGDTRVLRSLISHLSPEQDAVMQGAVKEWIWFDRASEVHVAQSDGGAASSVLTEDCCISDAQYAALLADAAVDILHVEVRRALPDSRDPRTSAELHSWLGKVMERAEALGLVRLPDQVVFAVLALDAPDGFEALHELEQTWRDVGEGATLLGKRIERWGDIEWGAIEHLQRNLAKRQTEERAARILKGMGL